VTVLLRLPMFVAEPVFGRRPVFGRGPAFRTWAMVAAGYGRGVAAGYGRGVAIGAHGVVEPGGCVRRGPV
jgi:hypothetical protein